MWEKRNEIPPHQMNDPDMFPVLSDFVIWPQPKSPWPSIVFLIYFQATILLNQKQLIFLLHVFLHKITETQYKQKMI